MPGHRRERACQVRCGDPAASALTTNRRTGVDGERRRAASCNAFKYMTGAGDITCTRIARTIHRNANAGGGRRRDEDNASLTDGTPGRC